MPAILRTQHDDDGVLIVLFDQADRPVNTITPQAFDELDALLTSLEHDQAIRGVIFTSAKQDGFIAGADLFEMSQMTREQMRSFLERGQRLFDRIERLKMPTVAAINGTCLGGGLELALACTYRVAADRGGISIGLPEVNIGLLPAWGGTTRMTRHIGLTRTLPVILAGKTMPPRKAQRAGIVDEVVRPEALLQAASRLLRKRPRKRRPGRLDRLVTAVPWLLNRVHRTAREQTLAKTFGNYPAPELLLNAAYVAARRGHKAGLAAERDAAIELADTDACRNLMRLFVLRSEAKKHIKRTFDAEPAPVHHAAVIGGGTMGAGIVHALIKSDIAVRLIEINSDAMSAALGRVKRLLDDDVRAKRLNKVEAARAMRRVSPTTHFDERAGLKLVDFVVEAVAEKIEIKRQVFAKLARLTRSDAVLASNTSSLSITELAETLDDPTRRASVIGVHFFNPVPRMPLVEIIRTVYSDDRALAAGAALALRIGKTPIVVKDGPGFVVNRVLIPYLAEALVMAAEGVSITDVDETMKRWGMPMGPFELLDQIGLDIAGAIFHTVGDKLGDHIEAPSGFEQVLERGWLGKKTGRGFYVYPKKKSRSPSDPIVNDELIALLRHDAAGVAGRSNDIAWRLVLPMINEAARLLHEGVFDSTDLMDLASVLGLGLAPFRGGLIRFTETVGLSEVVRRMEDLAERYGSRFTPIPELRELSKNNHPMQMLVATSIRDTGAVQTDIEVRAPAQT